MLVLSRKLGEKIVIGDKIVVTVVKIDRNQIRIGIEAPQDISVYREEIAPRVHALKTEARHDEAVPVH
jgi:carbon storage regulator